MVSSQPGDRPQLYSTLRDICPGGTSVPPMVRHIGLGPQWRKKIAQTGDLIWTGGRSSVILRDQLIMFRLGGSAGSGKSLYCTYTITCSANFLWLAGNENSEHLGDPGGGKFPKEEGPGLKDQHTNPSYIHLA